MASRGWSKIKSGKGKGKLVNSDEKTAFQVKQEKYYAAKASGGGGGGGADDGEIDFAELEKARTSQPKKRGYIKPKLQHKSEMTAEEKAQVDFLFGKEGRATRKGKQEEMQQGKTPKRSKSESKKNKEDTPKEGGMLEKTDTGTLKRFYVDEMSVPNPKKFNEAKLNEAAELIKKAGLNYDAVVVKQVGADRYEVIGNAFIYEAAKRAGIERINTIVGNEKAEKSLKANRDDEPDTLITGPEKDKVSKTYNMEYTDAGPQKYTYLYEINVKPTQQVNQKKVADAAKRFKEGERNWEPVVIRETGPDRFEVVGNAHLYEAAKQAGFDRLWTVIAGDETKEHKLGGKSKRKR